MNAAAAQNVPRIDQPWHALGGRAAGMSRLFLVEGWARARLERARVALANLRFRFQNLGAGFIGARSLWRFFLTRPGFFIRPMKNIAFLTLAVAAAALFSGCRHERASQQTYELAPGPEPRVYRAPEPNPPRL